jgi:sugar phosphate isomerase/epimerase
MNMKSNSLSERLAVCSWSLQPASPADLVAKLESTGIRRVQLALDPLRHSPAVWGETAALFRQKGITTVSGMFGCVGEDYSTLETIRATGGLAPDATWEQNWTNIRATAALAQQLGLKLVTFHAGFLPHEEKDPNFAKMLRRLAETADVFQAANIGLGLETGQETALVLVQLLQKLKRPNLGVNFDPANMILYDKGNPIAALRVLGPWIRQVHIKDARRTKVPGTWGEEVAAGTGEVDWPAFFAALREVNYTGDFVIEREAGGQRVADIRTAKAVVAGMGEGVAGVTSVTSVK